VLSGTSSMKRVPEPRTQRAVAGLPVPPRWRSWCPHRERRGHSRARPRGRPRRDVDGCTWHSPAGFHGVASPNSQRPRFQERVGRGPRREPTPTGAPHYLAIPCDGEGGHSSHTPRARRRCRSRAAHLRGWRCRDVEILDAGATSWSARRSTGAAITGSNLATGRSPSRSRRRVA